MSEILDMLRFTHLPSFAAWLLQHLDDYTRELIPLFYEADLPLLKAFDQFTEEQKFAFSKELNREFLTNLSQDNAAGHLEAVTNRWLAGQYLHIGTLDVDANDIAAINHMRSKAQKKFINRYTSDPAMVFELHNEIDELSYAFTRRSFKDYLQVLKDRLARETHFSQNIIEASPGIVFIYDLAEQREVYINGRVEEVTGYTPQEVLSESNPLLRLTYPDDKMVVHRFYKYLQQDRDGQIYKADYRFKVKSGEFHWMRCYAVVSKRNSKGEPKQVLGTAYNVSREKEIALQLERSNEQLQQFAAIASHDLKEPLRKISIFSNLIITSDWDSLPETARANLQRISAAAMQMQHLVEGVLSYSMVNPQLEKEVVSLETLLQEAIQNLEYQVSESGAEITSDGLPEARVIALQVQQLFQNLLANAMKFSKKSEPPRITITHSFLSGVEPQMKNLHPANCHLRVDVSDNGIGFGSEAAEKIFGLFQRLHNRSDFEGSGIGLAICRRIVENHGGVITALSEKGRGATFTFILPYDAC